MQIVSPREKAIEQEIEALKQEAADIKSRKTIKCGNCEKRTPIAKSIVLKKNSYTPPYSCSAGDYWSFANEYLLYCPKCDNWERVYTLSYSKSETADKFEFIQRHISYFGEVYDLYREETLDEVRENEKKRKQRRGY